jgi:WD40 repeat protein
MRINSLGAILVLFISATITVAEPVSFQKEIAPILHRRCATCHNEESSKGKYRLDTFSHLQRTGDSELPPVTPGDAEKSEIYQLLLEPSAEDRMPQKAEPLPGEEIDLIKRWLQEGARYDADSPDRPIVELARATLLRAAPDSYPRPVSVTALAFSPDGTRLATSGYFEVLIWNLEDGSLARRVGGMPQQITSLAWSPKGTHIAATGGTPGQWGTVALIETAGDYASRLLADFPETSLSVAFHPDGSTIAVGSGDRTTRFFDVTFGKQTSVLRQHSDWVQRVEYSRNGEHVLTFSRDRTARVIATKTREVEGTHTDHANPVVAGTFLNSDGSRALTVDRGKVLHEWDTKSGDKRSTLTGFLGEPVQIFAQDGRVITGGGSPAITIHQLSDDARLFTLLGHRDAVQSMALARNGFVLASGSADGEVLLWDLRCGTWTHRFIASPVRQGFERLTSTR